MNNNNKQSHLSLSPLSKSPSPPQHEGTRGCSPSSFQSRHDDRPYCTPTDNHNNNNNNNNNNMYNALYNGHFGARKCLCYTEVSFMWRLFYTVRNVIGTLGAVR